MSEEEVSLRNEIHLDLPMQKISLGSDSVPFETLVTWLYQIKEDFFNNGDKKKAEDYTK